MSRYVEIAHDTSVPAGVLASVGVKRTERDTSSGPVLSGRGTTFVVKLRNMESRIWGNQSEIVADTAIDAAEWAAGESLVSAIGDRTKLRARVWQTPFGSIPDVPFYVLG